MFKKKRIVIYYNSKGRNGNVFILLSEIRTEMIKQRRITEYNNLYERVNNALSKEEALGYICEKVDLVDVSVDKNSNLS
jgi:hypothetical protein